MTDGDWWSVDRSDPESRLFALFGSFEELLSDGIFAPFELSHERSDGELSFAELRGYIIEENRIRWSDVFNTSFTARREADLSTLWELYRYYVRLVGGEFPLEVIEETRNEVIYDLELLGALCRGVGRRAEILADRVRETAVRVRRVAPQSVSVNEDRQYLENVERIYEDIDSLFSEPVYAINELAEVPVGEIEQVQEEPVGTDL